MILVTGARPAQNRHVPSAIEFAIAMAMRAGKIIALRWADIDWKVVLPDKERGVT